MPFESTRGDYRCGESNGSFGYNALTAKYEDLVTSGVIDPTKVVRIAVASLLLTTEAMVAEVPEKHAPAGMPDMVGMGGTM